jgi:fluoroacetyl-CoA thioesterase
MDSISLVGIRGSAEMVVTDKDTAWEMGSGGVKVYATPSMIALMEKAAQSSVRPLMADGFVTVGTEVCVKHLKATPVGMRVTAESVLVRVEGKVLYFQVVARDERGEVGNGTHTRAIVNLARFMEKAVYS